MLLVLLPLGFAVGGSGTSYVLPGVIAGLVGVLALGAFYSALAAGTMGVVAPIASLGIALPVAAGLVRGEQPSAWQLIGMLIAAAGVVLASGPELSGAAGTRPLLLALCAAVGFGAVIVLLAQGSEGGGLGRVVLILLVMRGSSALALTLLWLIRRRPGLAVTARDLPLVAAIGLGDVGANAAYVAASQAGLLSVVGVLSSLYPVVTVLLARYVHGERLRRIQLLGVITALTGVVLLAGG